MNARLTAWLKKDIRILPPRQKKPPPPWVGRTAKIFQGLIGLLVLWFTGWRVLLYFEINNRFDAIRSEGLPISGQELNTWRPQTPDSENGTLVLEDAFALTQTFPDNRSNLVIMPELLERTNQWSADNYKMVEEYVLMNAPAIAQTQKGLQSPNFRFPADFSYALGTELPHLGNLKNVARIVALQAALAADNGNADDWPAQIALELKLASTLDEEPTVISYLVRDAIVQMAASATERGLARVNPGEAACLRLQDAFARAAQTNLLANALIGERALSIPVFRLSRAEAENASQDDENENQPRKPQRYSGKPQFFIWLTGFFERDLNFYLQTMEKSIELAKLPAPKSLVMTNQLEKADEVARKRFYFYSSMLLPSYRRLAVREATVHTDIEMAQVALAVQRFRISHGTWPENLQALTPEFLATVPADPFDGAPLRYRILNRGYVVYSIGADGHDDGGREGPYRKKSSDTNTYDITFTVTP